MDNQQLIDQLYEVLYHTENEAAFQIVGNAIDYVKGAELVSEVEITIDTEEMANHLFVELTKRGLVPSESDVEEISDIMFDYLIQLGVIDEE